MDVRKVGFCFVLLFCAVYCRQSPDQQSAQVQSGGPNVGTSDEPFSLTPNNCANVGLDESNGVIQINVGGGGSVLDSTKKIVIFLRDEHEKNKGKQPEEDTYVLDVRLRPPDNKAPPTFRADYTYYPGFGFYKYHTPATWPEARRICNNEGAHLPIVNTEAKARLLINMYHQNPRPVHISHPEQIHIGMHDLFSEGEFVTIFDEPLNTLHFTHWAPGNPSNSGGKEHCGTLREMIDLNDFPCKDQKISFICEKRLDAEC